MGGERVVVEVELEEELLRWFERTAKEMHLSYDSLMEIDLLDYLSACSASRSDPGGLVPNGADNQ